MWNTFCDGTYSSYSAKGPWNKSLNFIFPTKYVFPRKFSQVSHWLSKSFDNHHLDYPWLSHIYQLVDASVSPLSSNTLVLDHCQETPKIRTKRCTKCCAEKKVLSWKWFDKCIYPRGFTTMAMKNPPSFLVTTIKMVDFIFLCYMGVSKNRGIPKWMVKIMENPMNKWMIWGVNTPIFGSTPIYVSFRVRVSLSTGFARFMLSQGSRGSCPRRTRTMKKWLISWESKVPPPSYPPPNK